MLFFFNDTAATEIYTDCHTLSRPAALPIWRGLASGAMISAASSLTASSTAALTTPAVAAHSHPRGVPRRMITLLRSVGTKAAGTVSGTRGRSEEHTSELQSLMRLSYAVFCLKKKKNHNHQTRRQTTK